MSDAVFSFSCWPRIDTQLITKILNGNVKRKTIKTGILHRGVYNVFAFQLYLKSMPSEYSIIAPLLISRLALPTLLTYYGIVMKGLNGV